jgi:tRNA 2-thiouridine synthesizing protein A
VDEPAVIVVDASGHRCPTPTLRLRRALEQAEAGALVELIADDPLARIDVPRFVIESGHILVSTSEDGPELRFRIRKSAARPSPSEVTPA